MHMYFLKDVFILLNRPCFFQSNLLIFIYKWKVAAPRGFLSASLSKFDAEVCFLFFQCFICMYAIRMFTVDSVLTVWNKDFKKAACSIVYVHTRFSCHIGCACDTVQLNASGLFINIIKNYIKCLEVMRPPTFCIYIILLSVFFLKESMPNEQQQELSIVTLSVITTWEPFWPLSTLIYFMFFPWAQPLICSPPHS